MFQYCCQAPQLFLSCQCAPLQQWSMILFPLSEGQRPEVGRPLPINKLSQRPTFLCLFRGWPIKRDTTITTSLFSTGARVAKGREHSPPTNVAGVQIPASTSYVGRDCCWFSPLLREVFHRVLRFSPLLKNQHFQIPIRSGMHRHVSTSSYKPLSALWVNTLQLQLQYYHFCTTTT